MATDVTADITVLLEVEGFRREVHIKNGEDTLVSLQEELVRVVGKDVRLEYAISAGSQDISNVSTKRIYRLQRWSERRNCYVDITDASQIVDSDKLIAICPHMQSSSDASFDSSTGKVNNIYINSVNNTFNLASSYICTYQKLAPLSPLGKWVGI